MLFRLTGTKRQIQLIFRRWWAFRNRWRRAVLPAVLMLLFVFSLLGALVAFLLVPMFE